MTELVMLGVTTLLGIGGTSIVMWVKQLEARIKELENR